MSDYHFLRGRIFVLDKPDLDRLLAEFEDAHGRPPESDDVLLTSPEGPIRMHDLAYREVPT